MPKFVQTEPFGSQHNVHSMDLCTVMKDQIKRCIETQNYAKTYQKHSLQSLVHHEQQVELRNKVASGSTIADKEAT